MENQELSGNIEQRIILIRGQRIMLDVDLAGLYEVETRALNQAVKTNSERFPADFASLLTRVEIERISQTVISSSGRLDRLKFAKSVSAFTEHGVAMLSSVLRSARAIQVNIQIMRTFGRLRRMMAAHRELSRRMDEIEARYDAQFRVVFDAIRDMTVPPKEPPKRIGFHP
jgi:hypothetical protein